MQPQEFYNRGALVNPANRFEKISFQRDEEVSRDEAVPRLYYEDRINPKTEFFKDTSILTRLS